MPTTPRSTRRLASGSSRPCAILPPRTCPMTALGATGTAQLPTVPQIKRLQRDQLKRRIVLRELSESFRRRPSRHREVALYLALEAVQIRLQDFRLLHLR